MQILPGLLSGIALILFMEKSGFANAADSEANRAFLDPIDYSLGKKSCSDGFVYFYDHYVVTGFINITGYTPPKINAYFLIEFQIRDGPNPFCWSLGFTRYDLWNDTCTDIQDVPVGKCRCKYESGDTIRIKCNINADGNVINKPHRMRFETQDFSSSLHKDGTKVYRTSPHGGDNGMSGLIFLVTSLVCTVTSMFSNGQ